MASRWGRARWPSSRPTGYMTGDWLLLIGLSTQPTNREWYSNFSLEQNLIFCWQILNFQKSADGNTVHQFKAFIASFANVVQIKSYFHSVCLCVVFSLPGSSENWHMLSISALIMGLFYSPCLSHAQASQADTWPAPPELLGQEWLSKRSDIFDKFYFQSCFTKYFENLLYWSAMMWQF